METKDAIEVLPVQGGWSVEIHADESPESPREWDNFGVILSWHRRYNAGDENPYASPQDFLEVAEEEGYLVMPVYMYDHSVVAISTTPFTGRAQHADWDSGQVGFTYATKKEVDKCGEGEAAIVKAKSILSAEVATLCQFMTGEVYGFVVKNPGGDEVDSCWGFYDKAHATQEGINDAEYAAQRDARKHAANYIPAGFNEEGV